MPSDVYSLDTKLIIGATLLLVSILGSKFSVRLGMPTLVFFIIAGIATGKVLGIDTSDVKTSAFLKDLAKDLGVITLTFILFSGGLETEKAHIYPIWRSGLLLSTLGSLITALTIGVFLHLIPNGYNLSLTQGILVGAIVSSTDAAVVFSILRSRKINLKANIAPLLELESGSNDVMVYFLMTFLLGLLNVPDASIWQAIPVFFQEMFIGAIGGFLTGRLTVWVLNHINLPHQGLYPPLTLAMIFLPYALVNTCHGSGYLAVYLAGIILGNRDFIHRKSIIKFYEGFGWLLQIGMFIALGLLVDLETLWTIAPLGIALSLALMFAARPLSIFSSLHFSRFTKKQKFFISWVGLRGAVPIVFATYLYESKTLQASGLAHTLFHLIFFVVLVSILVQGSTLYPLAKKLRLEDKKHIPLKYKKYILQMDDEQKKILRQLEIPENSMVHGKPVVDLNLPEDVFIVLICRANHYLLARGGTILQAHDKLFVAANTKRELQAMKRCLGIA